MKLSRGARRDNLFFRIFSVSQRLNFIFAWNCVMFVPINSLSLCCDRKSQSGMCTKFRIVAASNNRVHMPWSLYYCLFAPHICGVVLREHPVRGESHIPHHANGEVAKQTGSGNRPANGPSFLKIYSSVAFNMTLIHCKCAVDCTTLGKNVANQTL